jgi:GT2 family glycosyltransferase
VTTISVAIATYERVEMLRVCIDSILNGSALPGEVIVVDQSRDDRTRLLVEEIDSPLLRYDHHSPPSISGSRNRSVELAQGEYVAIVDDDCEMPERWLADVRAELERFRFPDALYGEIRDPGPPDPKGIQVSLISPREPIVWEYPAHPGYMGYGAHTITRRSTFLALGGLDEDTLLARAEDIDYNYRLLKAGYAAVTSPAIWVLHHQWRPDEVLPADMRGRCFGQAALCAKHLRRGDRYALRILAEQAGSDARMFASGLRRRSRLRLRSGVARAAGTLTGLIAGWRAFSPRRRRRADS